MKTGSLNPAILLVGIVGIAICFASLSRYRESQRPTITEPILQPAVFTNALDSKEIHSIFDDEGRSFIQWTRMKIFLWVVPDENGVIRELRGDSCSFPADDEIEVIAKLSSLHTIWVRANNMTDVSLGYFAKNPSLKILHLPAPDHKFTNEGLLTFAKRRPDVTLHL